MKSSSLFLSLIALTILLLGCSTSASSRSTLAFSSEQNPTGVPQVEVQHDVQRFASEFSDRVTQGFEPLIKSDLTDMRVQALRSLLLLVTSATEIATGPSAEVNLLDMVWFVRLSRIVFESHWIPTLYGNSGVPALRALRRSEESAWKMAAKVLNADGRQRLSKVIDQWHKENADQVRVEFIRFSAFTELVGRQATREAEAARGLLAQVKSAMTAADSALLLGERTLFFAQRAPFLLRLQAQIGTRDIMADLLSQGAQAEKAVGGVRPVLGDVASLTQTAKQLVKESQVLANTIAFEILPPKDKRIPGNMLKIVENIRESLASAERIVDRSVNLIGSTQSRGPASVAQPVSALVDDADRLFRRWILYLMLLGASWAFFGWGGYYLAKRGLRR